MLIKPTRQQVEILRKRSKRLWLIGAVKLKYEYIWEETRCSLTRVMKMALTRGKR